MLDVIGLLISLVFGGPVMAAEAPKNCAAITDNPLRLLCYDEVAKSKPTATGDTSTPEPPAATTKEIVAAIAPGDFKVADADDLSVAPRKFRGKPIEMRHLHCYYADVADYRCVASGPFLVSVFTSDIAPPEEKTKIENDCGAMKALMTAKCERTLHLVVDDYDQDQVEMRNRIVIHPHVALVVPAATKKRR